MTKKQSKRRQSTSATKRKRQSKKQQSWAIPVVVGVVVVVVLAAALISLQNRQSPSSAAASDPLATAQPLAAIQGIPYPLVPRIGLDETQQQLELGQAVLVDVRSRASYEKSHATGAISIPEEEIDRRLDDLPRDKDLVLY